MHPLAADLKAINDKMHEAGIQLMESFVWIHFSCGAKISSVKWSGGSCSDLHLGHVEIAYDFGYSFFTMWQWLSNDDITMIIWLRMLSFSWQVMSHWKLQTTIIAN